MRRPCIVLLNSTYIYFVNAITLAAPQERARTKKKKPLCINPGQTARKGRKKKKKKKTLVLFLGSPPEKGGKQKNKKSPGINLGIFYCTIDFRFGITVFVHLDLVNPVDTNPELIYYYYSYNY
jgi:hypothetical protein